MRMAKNGLEKTKKGVFIQMGGPHIESIQRLSFLVGLCFFLAPTKALAQDFAGGDGTFGNPYQIETWAHLQNMQNDLSAHYRLNQDLNDASPGYATHVKDGTVLANGGAGWKPIGSSSDSSSSDSSKAPFTGHFNGNGHIIEDLYINRPGENELGLFGHIGVGGSIKTIGVSITIDDGAGGAGGNIRVGAVAGVNAGNIQETYSLGDVIGIDTVGGLVGDNSGTIRDSYSMVATTGNVVGGLVGKNTGTVDKSYSVGFVTPPGGKRDTFGGLVADNTGGTVTDSYWDQETTGTGGTGSKETARMKMRETFPTWDFVSIWAIEKGASASYPYLRNATQAPIPGLVGLAEYFGGGDGSVDAPFEIETWTHLHNIRQAPDKLFRLVNDLLPSTEGYTTYVADANGLVDDGKGWTPIASFSGRLTGARPDGVFKIEGLKINRAQSNVGLFSVLEPTAVIEDLILTEASITGQSSSGIVAGTSKGLLLRVGGGGSVNVNSSGGGLLGTMTADPAQAEAPAVERSFAHVDVTAAGDTAGGLVGFVAGINGGSFVLDSYSIGDVTATDQVGGLIGVSDGIVRRAYAAGQVSATDNTASKVGGLIGRPINTTNVTDSFYDTEATGQAYDPATDVGSGQPSASMKNVTIFVEADWNFKAGDGVWMIEDQERVSYPYLQAFSYDGTDSSEDGLDIPGLIATVPASSPSPSGSSSPSLSGSSQQLETTHPVPVGSWQTLWLLIMVILGLGCHAHRHGKPQCLETTAA